MEEVKRKPDPFTVGVSPDKAHINVKILDVAECARPSVQKRIHSAVQRYINKITRS